MPTRFSQSFALACLFAIGTSCAPIRYGEQELSLAHDAKADQLRLLIVYDSIQAEPQDDTDGISTAGRFAGRVSEGRREFMIFDWPLHIDVDERLKEGGEDSASAWKEWNRELRGLAAELRVVESGYCTGTAGRLGLFQQFEIQSASRWIALFERSLFLGIEESVAEKTFEERTPWFDRRSRELWIAMAREKRSWLTLKDGVLTVDLPLTSACAAQIVASSTRNGLEDPNSAKFVAGLFSHVSELRIADEHVVLRWKLDGPTWTFQPPKAHEYDDTLAKRLREGKALPESVRSRDEVTASFRAR